jgi:hypothetical protein
MIDVQEPSIVDTGSQGASDESATVESVSSGSVLESASSADESEEQEEVDENQVEARVRRLERREENLEKQLTAPTRIYHKGGMKEPLQYTVIAAITEELRHLRPELEKERKLLAKLKGKGEEGDAQEGLENAKGARVVAEAPTLAGEEEIGVGGGERSPSTGEASF